VTIYHGDCREILPNIKADVLVTDPPYGFGAYETDIAPAPQWLRKLVYRSRSAAVFGYPEGLIRWCVSEQLTPIEWVTWWPTNAIAGRAKWLQREAECIAIFGTIESLPHIPRSASSQHIARVASTCVDKDNRIMGDVWRDAKPGMAFNHHQRLHPNEKPLTLMQRLVSMCAHPGATVLDPYMGSGTTVRAAKNLGFRAIGIEIDERHCETAAKRCAQDVLGVVA
jgi:site-specific DNA-methyltransferase (adenine-specific)